MRRILSLVFGILLASLAWGVTQTQSFEPPEGSAELTRSIEFRCPVREETCGQLVPDILSQLELPNHLSKPSMDLWVPYTESEPFIRSDAERVWNTGMLENLWVEVRDENYSNGVPGKRIVFNLVKRDGDPVAPTGPPSPPRGFEEPASGHERLYP